MIAALRHYGNDLYLRDTATVTIDTTDYNDHTTGRTVTLKGCINAQGSAETPLTLQGRKGHLHCVPCG